MQHGPERRPRLRFSPTLPGSGRHSSLSSAFAAKHLLVRQAHLQKLCRHRTVEQQCQACPKASESTRLRTQGLKETWRTGPGAGAHANADRVMGQPSVRLLPAIPLGLWTQTSLHGNAIEPRTAKLRWSMTDANHVSAVGG